MIVWSLDGGATLESCETLRKWSLVGGNMGEIEYNTGIIDDDGHEDRYKDDR